MKTLSIKPLTFNVKRVCQGGRSDVRFSKMDPKMDKPVFDLFKEKTNFFELFFFLPLKNQRIHSPPTHAPKIFKTFLCVPIIGYLSEVLCSPAPSYKQNFKVKFCICGPITV